MEPISLGSYSHAPVVSPWLTVLLEWEQRQQQQQQQVLCGGQAAAKRARVAQSARTTDYLLEGGGARSVAQAAPRPRAPPPPPPPRRGRSLSGGSDASIKERQSGGCDARIAAAGGAPQHCFSITYAFSEAVKASTSPAASAAFVHQFYHAIVSGRERAVALAEVRLASARAAGASRARLVELLGDLAAAHAGGLVAAPSPFDEPEGARAAEATSAPPLPAPCSAGNSFALALARALDLLDPRDVGDWRASTPAALAALASGRASSSSSSSLSVSASASLASASTATSSPSTSLLDPRELRVRLSIGPSKGTTVSLAEMLTKPPEWFVATMADFGASNAKALSALRRDPLSFGEWLRGREGQAGLRSAAKLFSQMRAVSPAWVALDVTTAMETCSLSGFADEEGISLPSSSSAAATRGSGGGSGAVFFDEDDDGNPMRTDEIAGSVDGEMRIGGDEDREGERQAAANDGAQRRPVLLSSPPSRNTSTACSSSSLPSRDDISEALDAMRLSAEQRRTILSLRRDYLRARRAAAATRAEALSTLRGLLLLAHSPSPAKKAQTPKRDDSGSVEENGFVRNTSNRSERTATTASQQQQQQQRNQQQAPRRTATCANDIGRGAYAKALAAAAALSAAAAADAKAETEISVRTSSAVSRAQGATYNGLIFPRAHCVASLAELVAEQAGEPPAEAFLTGALMI